MSSFSKHMREANAKLKNKLFGEAQSQKQPVCRCPKHYTAPPQRKPLTDEEIYGMYSEPSSDAEMVEFARAVERAHGIGEKA